MVWWNGLSETQQTIFTLAGLLCVFVVGMTVGIIGVRNLVALEPLVHIGFGSALAAFLSVLVYVSTRFL
jgi:hypothetical protein